MLQEEEEVVKKRFFIFFLLRFVLMAQPCHGDGVYCHLKEKEAQENQEDLPFSSFLTVFGDLHQPLNPFFVSKSVFLCPLTGNLSDQNGFFL